MCLLCDDEKAYQAYMNYLDAMERQGKTADPDEAARREVEDVGDRQVLKQHGVSVQQIVLNLDMREPAFVLEQPGSEAVIFSRLLQVRAVAGTI